MSSVWSGPELEAIAALVETRVGLRFAPNRCESLELAVRQITRASSSAALRAFTDRLLLGGQDWEQLVSKLTVGETYFFRDYPQFELLEQQILPKLARMRGSGFRPRVWSAGCSTGEEAYSLAISLERQQLLEGAFVLGTDLNDTSLARARKARFTRWSLREVPPEISAQYLAIGKDGVSLAPSLRRHVQFERLNLAGVSYPSPVTGTFAMDVIFCRNVLIYFGPSTIAHVAHRLLESLAPGGFLFTGPSDPPLTEHGFEVEQISAGTIYRRPFAEARPRVSSRPAPATLPPRRVLERRAEPSAPLAPAPLELRAQAERAYEGRDESRLRELCRLHSEPWLWAMILRLYGRSTNAHALEAECRTALQAHPLSAELHYLHGLVSIELSRREQAVAALRRAIYLEPALAIAHFTLGSVLASAQDRAGAERSYQNALRWLAAQPEGEPLPYAAEISARGLSSAAEQELERLRAGSIAR